MYTLSTLLTDIYTALGQLRIGRATGGSASSLEDANLAGQHSDDEWKGGAIFILEAEGAAPQGEFAAVSAFDATSGVFSLAAALNAAVQSGDRGLATSGAPTTLEDADKNWAADVWAGAWVRIVKGQGAGQARNIISNTAMELVVAAWDQAPDSTSVYVIYATDLWMDISPTSGDLIDGVVSDVAVVDESVLLAGGASLPILRMRFNAALAVPAHEFDDDGANVADRLHVFHHSTSGPQVWRAVSAVSEISRATPTAWGAVLIFGSAIKVGDKSAPIRELFDYGGQLWALKDTGAWTIDETDKAHETALRLQPRSGAAHPQPLAELGGDLLFGWGHTLLQFSGGALTDIGPNRQHGLPAGRQGIIAALIPMSASRLAAAIDAGAGESSVMLYENGAWHELMRAPEPGQRITGLGLQDCLGRDRDCGSAWAATWLI